MELHALAGNAALKEQLSAQARGRGLSHAYLIDGPAGSGKRTLARLLAEAMVCAAPTAEARPCGTCPACKKVLEGVHPDVIAAGTGGRGISVGEARQLRADAYIRPNEAPRKVYILENAQDMNPSAQNALLKLLEEGPPYAAFLLLTDNPGALLQTIRSRCERLTLSPVSPREAEEALLLRFPDKPPEEVRAAAQRCGGVLGRAVEALTGAPNSAARDAAVHLVELLAQDSELAFAQWCVSLEKWDREDLVALMAQAVAFLRDALALQAGAPVDDASPEELPALRAAAALPRKRLLACAQTLEKLRSDAAFNVGSAHLCGALAAGVYGGQL